MSNKQFSKTIGNINNLSNFTCDSATINNLTANNFIAPIQPTGIYSTSTINNNSLIVGDLGSRNVKQTGVLIDSSNNITGATSLTGNIKTNSIVSIGANDDIVIDANGGGRVLFNTVINGGVAISNINSSNLYWISLTQSQIGSDRVLVSGSYYYGEWQPTIGGHTSGLTGWMPLWVNPGQTTIFGQTSSTAAAINANKIYVVGNSECTGTFRCPTLIVGGSSVVPGFTPSNLSLNDLTTQSYVTTTTGLNYVICANVIINNGFTITNSSTWVCLATGTYHFSYNFTSLSGVTDLRLFLEINGFLGLTNSASQYSNSITNFASDFLYQLTAGDSIRILLTCTTTSVVSNANAGYPIRKINIFRVA